MPPDSPKAELSITTVVAVLGLVVAAFALLNGCREVDSSAARSMSSAWRW
jgi:hypothetical protein